MILMFNQTNLDEVCIQGTHMESKGKNVNEQLKKKLSNHMETNSKVKGKESIQIHLRKKEKNLRAQISRKRVMMHPNVGKFTWNSSMRSFKIQKTRRPLLQPPT